MTLRLALAMGALLVGAGCSDTATSSTAPSSQISNSSRSTPAGSWSGSITDAISGEGTMQLTLTEQSTDSFTGAWAVTFKNGARLEGTAVAGVFGPGGYGIILYVQPQPTCTRLNGSDALGFTLVNVLVTSNRLTATSGRTSCDGPSCAQ
jgi:hypothetical protein